MSAELYHIQWHSPLPNVLQFAVNDGIDWETYHIGITKLIETASEVSGRIDIIFVANAPMPRGNPLPHLKRAIREFQKLENLVMVISVDPSMNRLTRMYADIVIKLTNPSNTTRFPFANSEADALAMIEADRARITTKR